MKTAIVYDRVTKWGGAERVLLTLHEMFPDAPLFTSVYDAQKAPWAKAFPKVYTSFLQDIPFAKNNHEKLGALMPIAFEQFDFGKFDLVISVTSEAAKGIITKPTTKHICYCLTPTRYLWSHKDHYFKNSLLKLISGPVVSYLKAWDVVAAQRPDVIIAISTEVKERIKKYYNRQAEVLFPPLTKLESIPNKDRPAGKHYLVVSRLVPYKRVDLVIEAFNKNKKPLVVVGTGSQESRLKNGSSSNIKFVKNLTDRQLSHYYFDTKALIMPQIEDFGLTAIEAQSIGVPVIAFAKGGAKDTVLDGLTGVLFKRQTPDGLAEAIDRFEKLRLDSQKIKDNAMRFSGVRFKQGLLRIIDTK